VRDPIFSWYITRFDKPVSRHRWLLGAVIEWLRLHHTDPNAATLRFESRRAFHERKMTAWLRRHMRPAAGGPKEAA